VVLDGSSLLGADGRFRIEAVRRLSQRGCVRHLGSGSSFTYRRDGWAGRCGWMLPILILTTTLRSFRFRHQATTLSSCAQLSSCGGDASTGHAR
jgi:hypothetical protein